MTLAVAISLMALSVSGALAAAKESYFEKAKFEVLSAYLRCSTCHESESGEGLTGYGRRIAAFGPEETVQNRVRRLERRIPPFRWNLVEEEDRQRVDLDQDGVLNWIEILCGADPADPKSTPAHRASENDPPTLRDRVEAVISCNLCHSEPEDNLGEEHAPHNAFGALIERMKPAAPPGRPGQRPPSGPPGGSPGSGLNAGDAGDSDFLRRFEAALQMDADKDRVSSGQEIFSFHQPADKDDAPTEDEAKAARDKLLAKRRKEAGFNPAHSER